MAKVFGMGMRVGEKYEARHVYPGDWQIVRLKRIDKVKPEPEIDAPYCVLLDANLCRIVKGKFAKKGHKVQVIIEKLLRSVDEATAKKIQPVAIGNLFKTGSGGAQLVGEHVDPQWVYKAIELCGPSLVRIMPHAQVEPPIEIYRIKLDKDLAIQILNTCAQGNETMQQTVSKVLNYLINIQ